LQNPATEIRKCAWLLIASGIAAYAIWGLMADDLVMPYRWWGSGGGVSTTRFLHLHGIWAIGGSICLLIGAAGFVVLFLGTLRAKPGTKPGAVPYRYLAAGLILVGGLFFGGVSILTHWFIR
jgi:hypothetical protein